MNTPQPTTRPVPSRLAQRTFARPEGMAGRLGGWIMSRNSAAQEEILDLLDVSPGGRILEVGHGPGVLLRLLTDRTGASQVVGVDPSPVMRRMAVRRCADAVLAGRVEVRPGSATATGLPDSTFDRIVSVNNVPFWDDIPAGFGELRRVACPEATVVVAFHSAAGPSRRARRIGLPDDAATRLQAMMAGVFGDVTRHDLIHLVAFVAHNAAPPPVDRCDEHRT